MAGAAIDNALRCPYYRFLGQRPRGTGREMKRLIAIALIICVAGLLSAVCGYTTTPAKVEYEITGTASTAFVTITNATGGTEQFSDVPVPHKYTFDEYGYWYLYISARNEGDAGSVTVNIHVDGRLVARSTSSGAYVTATASSFRW